jgi:hypothetical protein
MALALRPAGETAITVHIVAFRIDKIVSFACLLSI